MSTTARTRRAVLVAAALVALGAGPARAAGQGAGYHWPVKPFDREHPVRGNFGDPRTVFDGPPTRRTLMAAGGSFQFHFGIDISAPNGTAVYPVEAGVVTTVTPEAIVVAGAAGRSFQYWHLHAAVRPGERVRAYATVLGRIAKPCGHVHLSEIDGGVFVNPLQPGHLAPYHDDTAPHVTGIVGRRVAGGVELEATAEDYPSLPVPGAWHDLPVTPARVSWRLEDAAGRTILPERTVFDVTQRLPAPSMFWIVYARGTHQNMTTFRGFYAFRQPGTYVFDLGTIAPASGVYRVVVTAADSRGNSSTRTSPLVVGAN